MAQVKVRCTACGAMNADVLADRCRICGNLLPNAAERRKAKLGAATAGPGFSELVESEVGVWQQYDGRDAYQPRSRRPPDEPAVPRHSSAAFNNTMLVLLGLVAGAVLLFGAWYTLVRKDEPRAATSIPGIADSAWQRLDDPTGKFSIELPGTPAYSVDSSAGSDTHHDIPTWSVHVDDKTAMIGYIDFPAGSQLDVAYLQRSAAAIESGDVTLLTGQSVEGGPYPTYDAKYHDAKSNADIELHMVAVGTRLYKVTAGAKDGSLDALEKRLVESFQLSG